MTEKNYVAKGLTEKIMEGFSSVFGASENELPYELADIHPFRDNFRNALGKHDIDVISGTYFQY